MHTATALAVVLVLPTNQHYLVHGIHSLVAAIANDFVRRDGGDGISIGEGGGRLEVSFCCRGIDGIGGGTLRLTYIAYWLRAKGKGSAVRARYKRLEEKKRDKERGGDEKFLRILCK